MADPSRRLVLGAAPLALMACATTPADAPETLHASLAPLSGFIGRWRGEGTGQPGASTVTRSYTPVLGGRFIEIRDRSVYAPQQANPNGETHADIGYYSFDRERRLFVLRQFHVEGFVNQFTATAPAEGAAWVFASETIENIPPGFRARETYRFDGATLEEVFELAEPGRDFALYSRSRLTRSDGNRSPAR